MSGFPILFSRSFGRGGSGWTVIADIVIGASGVRGGENGAETNICSMDEIGTPFGASTRSLVSVLFPDRTKSVSYCHMTTC